MIHPPRLDPINILIIAAELPTSHFTEGNFEEHPDVPVHTMLVTCLVAVTKVPQERKVFG